jgi:pyochelin synthetase
VELGEIEAALLAHPGVVAAAACAIGERHADKHLAAYVTVDGGAPGTAELRDFLAERLPAYMVPTRITVLDRLPLTANGKIDRNALALGQAGSNDSSAGRPLSPRGTGK